MKSGVIIILNLRTQKKLFMAVLVGVLMLLAACGSDESDKSVDNDQEAEEVTKISVGLDPYDYATVPAYLSQVILEQEGYEVNLEEADIGVLYEALSAGDIDVFIDIWRPNLHEAYLEKYDDTFETAGVLYSDMPFGMGVPTYMEDINSIEDLADNAELFDNEIYSIEPGSGMAQATDQMVIDYEMDDFEVNNSSSGAMMSQMGASIDAEKPIAFNAWRPHPMFVNFDIKFLDDPRDSWRLDDVEVGVTPELKDESPTAHTLFSNMELDLDKVEDWLIALDEGTPARELAEEWVEKNQETVDEWLEK